MGAVVGTRAREGDTAMSDQERYHSWVLGILLALVGAILAASITIALYERLHNQDTLLASQATQLKTCDVEVSNAMDAIAEAKEQLVRAHAHFEVCHCKQ